MKQNAELFPQVGMITVLLLDASKNSVTPDATIGSMANQDLMTFLLQQLNGRDCRELFHIARKII